MRKEQHADAKQDKGYACKVLSNCLRCTLFGFYTKNCDITSIDGIILRQGVKMGPTCYSVHNF